MVTNIIGMIIYTPKLTTSNTFKDLSFDIVHNNVPDELIPTSWMFPKWPLKCLTNSIPNSCFFQNLICPSILHVMIKFVLRNTKQVKIT